jgi:hypothetical protein
MHLKFNFEAFSTYLKMETMSTGGSSASTTSLSRHMNESTDYSVAISDLSASRFSDASDVLSPFEARQELEERIKILHSYFSLKDSSDAVDSNYKTPDKRTASSHSLQNIFGSSTNAMLISDYCDLLVKDAVYSQPYFQVDNQLLNYLRSKICSPVQDRQGKVIVTQQTLAEFLGYKRNEKKSEKAKMKAQLLIDSYNIQMRICVQNWASLYFNPSLRISMYASVAKQVWRRNKDSSIGKFLVSQHVSTNDPNTIFGMQKSLR